MFSRRGGSGFSKGGFLGPIVKPVGAGVVRMWGGDACVAPAGGRRHSGEQDQGDASVPSPHNPSPAPTGTKALPRRCDTISTSKIHPVPMGQQQKMMLRGYGQGKVKAAALTSCAGTLYPDASSHGFDEAFAEVQPQACSSYRSRQVAM